MFTENLTEEEFRLVQEYRAKQKEKERKRAAKLLLLDLAYRYSVWLEENGAGSTYSTFCDDFQCAPFKGRDLAYAYIALIRNIADIYAAGKPIPTIVQG